MVMKRAITFFAAVLMSFVSVCPSFASALNDGDKKEDKDIIIRIGNVRIGDNHRAPARIPIKVSYVSFISALNITFINNLGEVGVNVTNHSTGDYLGGTLDASAGTAILPISGDEGFYTVTFILPNGTEYYGEFEL